jgi:hypothetical protein
VIPTKVIGYHTWVGEQQITSVPASKEAPMTTII